MPRLRAVAVAAALPLAAAALSGCVAIKSQSATQRLPGFVTLRVNLCVSDHNRSTYTTCDPSNPGANTAEADNGSDGDVVVVGGRGQLLAGFRVPTGAVAPDSFVTTDGSGNFTRSTTYTNALNTNFPPPAGFRWQGYLSTDLPFDPRIPNDRATGLAPEFTLPPGSGGAPFAGPFRWRAIVGFRQTGPGASNPSDGVNCSLAGTVCFDSPSTNVAAHLTKTVSDIGVLPGSAASVVQGQAATVSFGVQNLDAGALGARTVSLSATTSIPGAVAGPASSSLSLAANATAAAPVSVDVPPTTPPGTYTVTLSATANSGPAGSTPLVRTNTATITVVDTLAPAIRISTPADGATFTAGAKVVADFACTEETNGSGLRTCAAPVPAQTAIDTASPGRKTFTVSASDNAGNTASATRTYTVVGVVVPTRPPSRVNVTLAFGFPSATGSTAFTLLQVKGIPSGSTVAVTCRGKTCPTSRLKGKRKLLSLNKPNASGALSLKPWLKKRLRAGTVLTVTVTKPGSFGMIKKLTVRANKRPLLTTTCLQPNSNARATCED